MTCQTSFAVWVTFNTTNKNKNRNSNMFMQKEQQVDHGIPIWCLLDWLMSGLFTRIGDHGIILDCGS